MENFLPFCREKGSQSPRPKIPKRLTRPSVRGIISLARKSPYAPVAQLDRVSDSDSEGHAFESHRAYQVNPAAKMVCGFFFAKIYHLYWGKTSFSCLRGSKRGSIFPLDGICPVSYVLRLFCLPRQRKCCGNRLTEDAGAPIIKRTNE